MRKILLVVSLLVILLGTSAQPAFAQEGQGCDTNPPDGYTQQISGIVEGDELVIQVSSRFAGAVDSLTWRGKEFINIFDHGRQISYAWQMEWYGECFNPTEPGSASDLFSQTSTSELLEVCTSDENILTTKTKPAYWLAPGETGFCDSGTITAVNDTLVADQLLEKNIEIGYGGIDNVIAFTADITLNESYNFLQLEIPTGYLTYEFTNYWVFDPSTGELQKPESQPLIEPWSFVYASKLPPILATEDGQYAMGAYSPENVAAYEILFYDIPNPDDRTNKWNIVLQEQPAPAGIYSYQSFAIVGTLEQVTEAMQELFALHPTDIFPPEGYIDLANCDRIEGWAWDPKSPGQPIEVEFRTLNKDGSETVLSRIPADVYRQDLASALGDNGEHGFSVRTSEILRTGDQQTLRVYGLNSNRSLPPRPLLPAEHVLTCPQLGPTAAPPATASPPPLTETEDTESAEENGVSSLPCIGGTLPLAVGLLFLRRKRALQQ